MSSGKIVNTFFHRSTDRPTNKSDLLKPSPAKMAQTLITGVEPKSSNLREKKINKPYFEIKILLPLITKRCEVCEKSFPSWRFLKKHVIEKHHIKTKCNDCDITFD